MRVLKHTVRAAFAAILCILLPWSSVYAERADEDRARRAGSTEKKVKSVEVFEPDNSERVFVRSQPHIPDYVPPPRTIADMLNNIGSDRAIPPDCPTRRAKREAMLEERRLWLKRVFPNTQSMGDVVEGSSAWQRIAIIRGLSMKFSEEELLKGNLKASIDLLNTGLEKMPKAGWWAAKSKLHASLARTYALGGNFSAADARLGRAKSNALRGRPLQTYPSWRSEIDAPLDLAEAKIAESRGFYALAETHYRKSLQNAFVLRSDLFSYPLTALLADIARNLMHQGRLAEAEFEARRALLVGNYGQTPKAAPGILVFAEILYEQGRYAEAETLARQALNVYLTNCLPMSSIRLALARQMVGRAALSRGDGAEAIAQFEAIREGMAVEEADLFQRKFSGDLDWGLALLKTGRTKEAVAVIESGYERNRTRLGETNEQTAMAQGFMAMARAADGDRARALDEFRQAIP